MSIRIAFNVILPDMDCPADLNRCGEARQWLAWDARIVMGLRWLMSKTRKSERRSSRPISAFAATIMRTARISSTPGIGRGFDMEKSKTREADVKRIFCGVEMFEFFVAQASHLCSRLRNHSRDGCATTDSGNLIACRDAKTRRREEGG